MRKLITILIGLLVVISAFGQTRVNKRILLDSLQNKVAVSDTSAMLANYALSSEVAEGGAPIGDVRDEITDSLNVLRPTVRLLADTIPIFVFGLGSGVAADTAVFNDNAIAGAFYNAGSDTLNITSLMGVLAEGSGTETIAVQVSWHATFKSGSATNLNSSALTINSITTGTSDTSFDNEKIPPGVFVWCTLSGTSAGNRPSLLILTMSGYKIPKY